MMVLRLRVVLVMVMARAWVPLPKNPGLAAPRWQQRTIMQAQTIPQQPHKTAHDHDHETTTKAQLALGGPDSAKYAAELRKAYDRCGEITKIFSKTFYFGTTFFTEAKKTAVWAIYVWCRRTDDIVDSPLATMLGPERMARDLEVWEQRLEKIWVGEPTDSLDMALADAKFRYPDLDVAPYKDMIKGMLMDTPGHELYKNRYATWDELEVYCYRVAGTVGLMTLPVLGTAPGYSLEDAKEPALSLGLAFQLTNILRDVGEDALRGRVYLPQEDLERFGVSEQQVIDGIVDDKYKALLDFEMDRAEQYYAKAAEGIPMLAPEARLAVASSLKVYKGILDKIKVNQYDNFRNRAFVSKVEKFAMLPQAFFDIQRLVQEAETKDKISTTE